MHPTPVAPLLPVIVLVLAAVAPLVRAILHPRSRSSPGADAGSVLAAVGLYSVVPALVIWSWAA